jgi:hypothetical protein
MSRRTLNGIDANNQRIVGVGDPSAPTDGVNKRFIRYDWPTGCVGKPAAGEVFPYFVAPLSFIIPASMLSSRARAITPATADATFTLNRVPVGSSTVSPIATLKFAAGSSLGVFTMATDTLIADSDFLYWIAPATQDNTLSDFSIVVAGVR